MVALYSLSLFWGAFLLFSLQPMVGKLLLPLFGGTPAVWNVCMVFFQTALLGGYFYANRISRIRPLHWQALLHLALLAFAFWFLAQPWPEQAGQISVSINSPIGTLLGFLLSTVALPFLLLSSTASLLQSWFSTGDHASARDPYYLYAASNLGSLAGLLLYPLAFEPLLFLSSQFTAWRAGFVALVFLVGACGAWRYWRPGLEQRAEANHVVPVSRFERFSWVFFSFVPASLLIGITTYLSTDVAAVPLLWVLPLILYLASFVIAFSRPAQALSARHNFLMGRVVAFGACVALLGIILESNQPALLFFPAHLVLFFLICLLSHLKLAQCRPQGAHLTDYYLWISMGGALGGIFSTLVAPGIFTVVVEYPLLILVGSTFRNGRLDGREHPSSIGSDLLLALFLAALVALLSGLVRWASLEPGRLVNLLVLGPAMILAYRFVQQPRRYAIALVAIYFSSLFLFSGRGHHLIYRERTFFGTNKVEQDSERKFMMFFHGSTLHGQQALAAGKRSEPLAYFSRRSPIAQVFEVARAHNPSFGRVGIVGLGAGTLATYAKGGERWTYYELDPHVLHLARDSGYFSFLRDSPAFSESTFVLGDARLMLRAAEDAALDLLVLDAFSSDSIPAHLLTKEALQLYWRKLGPEGVLVFNVSSRYFNFAPTMAALARESGALAFLREHDVTEEEAEREGIAPSAWILMVKNGSSLAPLLEHRQWKLLIPDSRRVWTDDYSNILSLMWD